MNRNARLSIAILTLSLAACSMGPGAPASPTPSVPPSASPPASASPSPTQPPQGLDGRSFLSVAVTEDGAPRPLAPDTRIRLNFDGTNLGASAGCNQIGGTYELDGDRIVYTGGAMTEMGCDPPRHAQDDWLVAFLGSGPTYALNGHDLVLTSGTTVVTLLDEEAADPDRPLVGTTWTLTTIFSGGPDGAAVSIPEGVVATLTFNEDGTVDVHPGCNQGSGTYTVDGDTITFGDIAMTAMGCDDARGQVEADVVTVLGAATVQFAIDGAGLTLETEEGGLQFTAS